MRLGPTHLELSATDLSNFLGCRHRTALDMAVARKARPEPAREPDPLLELLWKRGLEHEARFVETLEAKGLKVTDLREIKNRTEHVEATIASMKAGADVIVQGALRDGRWFGLPDVLLRTDHAAALFSREPSTSPGSQKPFANPGREHSYEVIDTKLSRETKAGTVVQLGLYSEMLGLVQGVRPEYFHVVTPDPIHPHHSFRLDDFSAYFRLIRSQMLATVVQDHDEVAGAHYPEPVAHCDICRWNGDCAKKRRDDDHLSLVAFASRMHRRELEGVGITTLTMLATTPLPEDFKPKRGSVETYMKVREQAMMQHATKQTGKLQFKVRDIAMVEDDAGNRVPAMEGLCRLPEPSAGDVFLDLEGAPFAAEGGREYLFGLVTLEPTDAKRRRVPTAIASPLAIAGRVPVFQDFWAFTESEEKKAFEAVMDTIMARWEKDPGMHIYHYAPYEPSAFKRLIGRHVTRSSELDRLLKAGKFVDLYAVVRQGLFVGSESYSIKKLEPLYSFKRNVQLMDADRCRQALELSLDLSSSQDITPEIREAVRGYNKDDCVSTLRLRDWLENVRAGAIESGKDIPRPAPPKEEEEKLNAHEQRVKELRPKLLKGVPEERTERDGEQQARWLLAHLLDFHNREAKASFWEYYRLREMPEEDLFDEPQAITGMEFVDRIDRKIGKNGKPTGTVTDRYRYPAQEMEIDRGNLNLREGGTLGKLVAVDREARTVDIEKGPKQAENHPKSVFAYTFVASRAQEDSLYAIAERVVADGGVKIGNGAPDHAARSLLLGLPPALKKGTFSGETGDDPLPFLTKVVLDLDQTVLPIQGPPGAGKTYSGAAMIATLVAQGRKVGIAANSHKVIRNLLDALCDPKGEARRILKAAGVSVKLGHKCDDDDEPSQDGILSTFDKNETARDALANGEINVLGATAWLWSRADMAGSVEVLFVDEAGQMALANALAMSPAARSIVLLGDPQQLEQPIKASHPDGVRASALGHLTGGRNTIPADRGVLLPVTWRMCDDITRFTSELFYESRLKAKDGLDKQVLAGTDSFDGNGLFVVKADHDGNRTSSPEEIAMVRDLVERLTAKDVTWTDKTGRKSPIRGIDILIVAPYNAQVSRLAEALEDTGARVGTVDKFQGQEAPIVIYSMTTSRPEDAPRGMEFLYSLNRLNVASSRARCAAIVVACDRLFEPECRTVRQMKLANALCRYRELATETQ